MPSCIRTPEHLRFAKIKQIAHRADTLAVLLAAIEFMPTAAAVEALNNCASVANEVAASLTSASIGGAA